MAPDTPASRNLTQQPIVIALAIAAALGWIVAIWSLTSSASQERDLTGRIQELEAGRTTAVSQLEELRRTGGTLADIQGQITALQANLEQLRLQQEQATASLSRVRDELGPAEQRLTDLQAQIKARTARVAELQGQADNITRQLEQSRQELAVVEQNISARAQELASVGERLLSVRQEETRTRQELSRLTAAAAEKVAEMGAAEHRLQQARQAEAQAQRSLAASRESLAELERSRTATTQILNDITANRDRVITELQQAQERSAIVQRQLAELVDQLTTRRNELTAVEQRLPGGMPEGPAPQNPPEPGPAAVTGSQNAPVSPGVGQREFGCEQTASGWVCSAPQGTHSAGPEPQPMERGPQPVVPKTLRHQKS